MFLRAANLLLSLLIVVASLGGNCVACPQFFQPPIEKQSCCDAAGHCKNTRTDHSHQKSCQFQQFEHQHKLKLTAPCVTAELTVLPSVRVLVPVWQAVLGAEAQFGSLPESPHQKQAALSTFLI
jgi:hypothetical protein